MGPFFKILKQERDLQFIFAFLAAMILLGIGCAIFAFSQSPTK